MVKRIFNSLWLALSVFFFTTISSFGLVDFDGSLRSQILGTLIQDQVIADYESIQLKGAFRPNENFATHFWIRSSFSILDKEKEMDVLRWYGYGEWFFNKEFSLSLGRRPYESSFHQIISSNPFEPYPHTLDAFLINYSTRLINLDIWGAHISHQEETLNESEKPKTLDNGVGIFLDIYSVSDFLNRVNLHLVYLSDTFFEEDSSKMTRYGIAIDGNLSSNLAYQLIGIAHGSGFKFKSEQNMYHMELSYSQLDWQGSRFFGGYHKDTEAYDPWLYDRHKNGGFLDLLSWGNLNYLYLGYEISLATGFDLQIIFHKMKSTQAGHLNLGRYGPVLQPENTRFNQIKIDLAEEPLGQEIALILDGKINEKMSFNLLFGGFLSQKGLQDLLGVKSSYYSFQFSSFYKF